MVFWSFIIADRTCELGVVSQLSPECADSLQVQQLGNSKRGRCVFLYGGFVALRLFMEGDITPSSPVYVSMYNTYLVQDHRQCRRRSLCLSLALSPYLCLPLLFSFATIKRIGKLPHSRSCPCPGLSRNPCFRIEESLSLHAAKEGRKPLPRTRSLSLSLSLALALALAAFLPPVTGSRVGPPCIGEKNDKSISLSRDS